jgi:hypothetical protein
MNYVQPTNREEYDQAMMDNTRISGRYDQVTTHSACFFCGAPDFVAWRIVTTHEDMAVPATCKECGRTAAMLSHYANNGVVMWPVQLAGPPAPEWASVVPWNGCPAKRLQTELGEERPYINIPDNGLRQLVCIDTYNHEGLHDFAEQGSELARQSRSQFLSIIDG